MMKCNISEAEGKTLRKNVYSPITEEILYHKNNILSKDEIEVLLNHGILEVDIEKSEDISSFPEFLDDMIYDFLKHLDFKLLDDIVLEYNNILDNLEYISNDMTIYTKTKREDITPKLLTVLNTNFAVTIAKTYNSTRPKKEQIDIDSLIKASLIQDIGLICSTNKLYLDNLYSKYEEDIKNLQKIYNSILDNCLEEYSINMHPIYSYYIAKDNNFDEVISNSVLLHEEGYEVENLKQYGPLEASLKQEKFDESKIIASIIKASDSYNRLLFALAQQNKETPFISLPKHLDKLAANGVLSPEIVKIIKYVLPVYQLGTKVLLSDGTIGIVSGLNPNNMVMPKLIDLNGNEIQEDEISISYPL